MPNTSPLTSWNKREETKRVKLEYTIKEKDQAKGKRIKPTQKGSEAQHEASQKIRSSFQNFS